MKQFELPTPTLVHAITYCPIKTHSLVLIKRICRSHSCLVSEGAWSQMAILISRTLISHLYVSPNSPSSAALSPKMCNTALKATV